MCRKSFLLFLRIINIGLLSTNTPINFLKIYFSSFHLHNYYLILFRGYIDLLYFFYFGILIGISCQEQRIVFTQFSWEDCEPFRIKLLSNFIQSTFDSGIKSIKTFFWPFSLSDGKMDRPGWVELSLRAIKWTYTIYSLVYTKKIKIMEFWMYEFERYVF